MTQGFDDGTPWHGTAKLEPAHGLASNCPGGGPITRVVGEPVADPAPETARLYAAEWARFVAWCRETKRTPLPASGATRVLAAHA